MANKKRISKPLVETRINASEVWREVLSPGDRERFVHGHWDKAVSNLRSDRLRAYLSERYA
jgi:hypothetical protein